jgi:hypothetical protein
MTKQPKQPTPEEQSGSTGRPTKGTAGQGKDTGQGRYGQTGAGGGGNRETIGQANYRRSGADVGQQPDTDSNAGSGSSDQVPEDQRRNRAKPGGG